MRFGASIYFWLLLIAPLLALFFWHSWRKRQALLELFIRSRLLPGLLSAWSPGRRKFRHALLIGAFVFLALTLARPQWGFTWEEARQRGVDIIIAIDASKSMLADDVVPNRMERAKLAALDFIRAARGDRLGLVTFAGTAFLQCPLTLDDQVFRQNVDLVDITTMPVGGSDLAAAIDTAAQALLNDEDNFKVLVLLTDGEDHDTGAVAAAQRAAEAGLRIFTIGIGTTDGALLRIRGPDGRVDFARDPDGNVVKSRLNERLLHEISGAGGGFYLPLRGADTVETVYEKGIEPLPKTEFNSRLYKRFHERYHWPLAIALLLIVAESLLPDHRRSRNGLGESPVAAEPKNQVPRRSPHRAAAVTCLLIFAVAAPLRADPRKALQEYEAGHFEKSLEEYNALIKKKTTPDPRLHYNAGAAAYRSGDLDQALEHYQSALQSQDLALQQNAYFNIGNTLYRAGDQSENRESTIANWENAIQSYESALKLNPEDAPARHNQELVKQQLELLKQQPPSEMQGQDSSQNDDQDQSEEGGQSGSQGEQDQQNQQQAQDSDTEEGEQDSQARNSQPEGQQDNDQQQQDALAREAQEQQQESTAPSEPDEQQAAAEPQPAPESQQQTPGDEEPAPGQMTPEQAERLLDRARDGEKTLNFNAQQGRADSDRIIKDW